MWDYKQKLVPVFTSKYNIKKLVYFEVFQDINEAIFREKQIKAGSREKKLQFIEKQNPLFDDLYPTII